MLILPQMSDKSNPFREPVGPLKKRILFIITQSEYGGAQKFLFNLVSHLDDMKYEFMVATGTTGDESFLKTLRDKNIPTHTINSLKRHPSFGDLEAVFETRKLVKSYKPDVLFLNSSKAGFIGSLASVFPKRIPALKVIYRIGGWSFNDPGLRFKKLFLLLLEWLSAQWKDIIIVNNQHDLNQAKKFHIRPRRNVHLVHNGLDVYKLNFLPKEEARLKLFEKAVRSTGKVFQIKSIVGTIANFYSSKGLECLIKAAEYFRDNNDLIFFIIGDGDLRSELERLITKKRLEKRVILLGRLPDAYRLLNAFDLFVLPSQKEGFPWVLIEAMAAKLPVIATRVGAIPDIIEDHKNGVIVDRDNPAQLAQRIKEILDNDLLRNELGIQGHQTVLFKFELEKMVKRIEELI